METKDTLNSQAAVVVDLDAKRSEAKQHEQEQEKEKKKPTSELLWSNELRRKNEYAVERDISGNPILYKFDKGERYWKAVDSDSQIREEVVKFLNCGENLGRYTNNAVENLVKSTTPFVASFLRKLVQEDKKVLISTINHILEVEKGQILVHHKNELPHQGKEYFCNTHISVDLSCVIKSGDKYYVPQTTKAIEAKGTYWAGMVTSCFTDERNRETFQEFFGDLLNPQRRKAIPVLVGPPDCGKSQFILVGLKLHKRSGSFDLAMEGFALESVIGKSVLFVDELPKRLNETAVKRMVGGAVVNVNRKNKTALNIIPNAKMFWCANKVSDMYDKSGAMQSRVYPIWCNKFNGKIIDDVANLAIENDMVDILDWCLNGAQKVMQRGRIIAQKDLPQDSQRILEDINKKANPAFDFIQDTECVFDEFSLIDKQDVYKAFVKYCEDRGYQNYAQINDGTFFRDLFLPAIKQLDASFDERLCRRATKTISAGGKTETKRVYCYPVKFKNDPFAKVIDKNEATRSYYDKNAYDKENAPDHIVEMILKDAEEQQDCLGLTDAQKKIYIDRKMKKEGYAQAGDGSWFKDYVLSGNADSIDF